MEWEEGVKMMTATFAFARMVADEFGEEKALELMGRWSTAFAQQGMTQKKQELGITGTSPKDLYNCFSAYDAQFGLVYEIEKETDDYILHRIKNCGMPQTCLNSGWDCKKICETIIYPLCDNVSPIISPDLKWEVVEFNPDITKGCAYKISYKQP